MGELATPRWARGQRRDPVDVDDQLDEEDEEDFDGDALETYADAREKDPDLPDSPWTIEAIDGEQDETPDVSLLCRQSFSTRTLMSFSFLTYSPRRAVYARGAHLLTRAEEKRFCILVSLHPPPIPGRHLLQSTT